MIEAYEIGVSLILDDAITGALSGVYDQFQKVEEEIAGINASLSAMPGLVGDVTGSLAGLVRGFADATTAAQHLKEAAGGAGAGLGGGGGVPPPSAPAQPFGTQAAYDWSQPGPASGETAYVMPRATAQSIYMGGLDGLPGVTPPPAPASTAMTVVPGESAHGPESWGHVQITGKGDGTGPSAGGSYNQSLGAPGDSGGGSGAPPTPPSWTAPAPDDEPFNDRVRMRLDGQGVDKGPRLGLSDLFFGKAAVDEAGNIVAQGYNSVATPEDQVTKMRLDDKAFTQADADKVMAAAKWIVAQNIGIGLPGALQIIAKGYSQTHDVDESIAMAWPLAEDAARLNASGRVDAVDGLTQLQTAAEIAGTLNKKNKDGSVNITPFENWIDAQTKILQSDPMVTTNDILLQTQQNDLGAMQDDIEGQSEQDILAGLLGGYKSGTGGAQLERELIGGKMSTGTEHVLEKLGLIDPAGATKTGAYYTLAPHALKDEEAFTQNPVKWFETVFAPAVDKISPDDRNAMYHDLIAGTGTASGARSAALDVMQDVFINRLLAYAEDNEPSKGQSIDIIKQNPSTAAQSLGQNLSALENTIFSNLVTDMAGYLHWESARAYGYETHPFKQTLKDTVDASKWLWDYATEGGMPKGTFPPSSSSFGMPQTSAFSPIKDFENLIISKLKGFFDNLTKAIEGQPGNSPSDPVFVKQVPNGPSMPMPSGPTSQNPTQSPPMPGQSYPIR